MKKQKVNSPFEIMITIVDKGDGENVIKLLEQNNITHIIALQGTGTAESEVAELFGFGVVERDVIICLIDETRSKALVELVYTDLNLGVEHSGFVFTICPSASTLDLINTLKMENSNAKN